MMTRMMTRMGMRPATRARPFESRRLRVILLRVVQSFAQPTVTITATGNASQKLIVHDPGLGRLTAV